MMFFDRKQEGSEPRMVICRIEDSEGRNVEQKGIWDEKNKFRKDMYVGFHVERDKLREILGNQESKYQTKTNQNRKDVKMRYLSLLG